MNKLSVVVAAAVSLAILDKTSVAAPNPGTQAVTVDIASQPLGDALNKLSELMNLQFVFYSQVGKGISAPRLSGSYTAQQALDRLLAHTGLVYEYLDARTVAIREE